MSETAYDAVVIGSGLAGLTAAALLSKSGRRVCVIERNHSVGEAASVFKKGALTIEASLQQTADPHDPSEPKHAILTELGLLAAAAASNNEREKAWGSNTATRPIVSPLPPRDEVGRLLRESIDADQRWVSEFE